MPASASKKKAYAKRLNKIAGRYGRQEDATIRSILAMFKTLRNDIAGAVTAIDPDKWEHFRLKALGQHLDRMIDKFERQLRGEVKSALENAVADGRDSVLEPLIGLAQTLPKELQDVIGTRPVLFTPSISLSGAVFMAPTAGQANVALDFSAELIQNIVEPMRAQINVVLSRAILGRMKPLEAMKAVTKILGVEAKAGVWAKRKPIVSGVAARAETDVRTEMQRMYNVSHHGQMQMLGRSMDGLTKRWIATSDLRTRGSHLLIHRRTGQKPIPIHKPFILEPQKGEQDRGKRFKLMYPGDPTGPPGLTINCRCKMAVIHPEIGVIGSSLDGRIGAELKRRGIPVDVVKEAIELTYALQDIVADAMVRGE